MVRLLSMNHIVDGESEVEPGWMPPNHPSAGSQRAMEGINDYDRAVAASLDSIEVQSRVQSSVQSRLSSGSHAAAVHQQAPLQPYLPPQPSSLLSGGELEQILQPGAVEPRTAAANVHESKHTHDEIERAQMRTEKVLRNLAQQVETQRTHEEQLRQNRDRRLAQGHEQVGHVRLDVRLVPCFLFLGYK